MEDNSPAVHDGHHIGKTTYDRRPKKWRELDLGSLKIDHYDPTNKLIREVKKSPKLEHVHVAQVKYYLYALEERGVNGASGIIEYPKQRKTTTIKLTNADRLAIKGWITDIEHVSTLADCPALIQKPYCKKCAFYDFCYS